MRKKTNMSFSSLPTVASDFIKDHGYYFIPAVIGGLVSPALATACAYIAAQKKASDIRDGTPPSFDHESLRRIDWQYASTTKVRIAAVCVVTALSLVATVSYHRNVSVLPAQVTAEILDGPSKEVSKTASYPDFTMGWGRSPIRGSVGEVTFEGKLISGSSADTEAKILVDSGDHRGKLMTCKRPSEASPWDVGQHCSGVWVDIPRVVYVSNL